MSNLQTKLFNQLENRLGPHVSLTKWLAETLDIEYSVAYRKASGHSRLQLEQFAKIVEAYPPLLSSLFEGRSAKELFVGQYRFYRSEAELNAYLKSILNTFQKVQKEDFSLKYFSREWPFLLFLKSELVLDYKLSMWLNTLNSKGLTAHSMETHRLAQEIVALYEALPSEEIWHRKLFSNQWLQLRWNTQYGALCDSEMENILDEVRRIIEETRGWCENGEKNKGAFNLMISSFSTMTNNGLLTNGKEGSLLSAISGVSHIATEAPSLIANFEAQFEEHKSCSVCISKVNAMARAEFFNSLQTLFQSEPYG